MKFPFFGKKPAADPANDGPEVDIIRRVRNVEDPEYMERLKREIKINRNRWLYLVD